MTPKANEIQFTVNLSTDVLERLKSMAEHGDISRHKLTVNILRTGIEQIELLKHVGIFQLGVIVRNITASADEIEARKYAHEHSSEMPIPLRIDKSLIERLESIAEKADMSRQRLAQNIIKTGLEELETARKYKLTDIALKVRDLQDLFTNVLEIGKQAFYAGKEVKQK